MEQIEEHIKLIKQYFGDEPQCYLVALFLATEFKGEIWYDNHHCLTRIKDKFYDKHGLYEGSLKDFCPLKRYGFNHDAGLMQALIEKHSYE
jgi:hypothetical protein